LKDAIRLLADRRLVEGDDFRRDPRDGPMLTSNPSKTDDMSTEAKVYLVGGDITGCGRKTRLPN